MSNEHIVRELRREYDRMIAAIAEAKEEEERASRERVAAKRLELERAFAIKFATARNSGLKRMELDLPVLRTRDGRKYKYFIELGGGSLTKLTTRPEREALAVEAERVSRVELLAAAGLEDADGIPNGVYVLPSGVAVRFALFGDGPHLMPVIATEEYIVEAKAHDARFVSELAALYEVDKEIV